MPTFSKKRPSLLTSTPRTAELGLIDYTVAVGGALLSWAALVFFSFSGTLQIIIPAVVAVGGGIGVVPWSRSFWTLFLYITGEMIAADARSN